LETFIDIQQTSKKAKSANLISKAHNRQKFGENPPMHIKDMREMNNTIDTSTNRQADRQTNDIKINTMQPAPPTAGKWVQ